VEGQKRHREEATAAGEPLRDALRNPGIKDLCAAYLAYKRRTVTKCQHFFSASHKAVKREQLWFIRVMHTSRNVVFGIFAGYALFQARVIITLTLAVVFFDT
jgi:hypothetical protein